MKIIAHKVGNKINGESLMLSQNELQVSEEMKEVLESYFLGSFKSEETFRFYNDGYLSNNQVYTSAREIFEDTSKFSEESESI